MLRVVGCRLGGRIGRTAGSSLLQATGATTTAAPLIDVVLPRVNCNALKSLLASASPASAAAVSAADIPDVAPVLRLDYTTKGTAAGTTTHLLADVLLVNRIHAAVIADTRKRAMEGKGEPTAPLLVLVETDLPTEDAEVQQFVLRNALRMHPLPKTVIVEATARDAAAAGSATAGDGTVRAATPLLVVMVLPAELTQRVRSLPNLPNAPSPIAVTSSEKTLVAASLPPPPPQLPMEPFVPAKKKVIDAAAASAAAPLQTETRDKKPSRSTAASLLRQRAATQQKPSRGRRTGVRRAKAPQQRHTQPTASTTVPARSLPPRLLAMDDTTEKVLWASRPGHPLALAVLAPLINRTVLAKMSAAASNGPHTRRPGADAADASLRLHTVVYRAGAQSSAQTLWMGALQAAAALTGALSNGRALLPAAVKDLSANIVSATSSPGKVPHPRKGKGKAGRRGRSHSVDKRGTSTSDIAAASEAPYVYLLIHTSLSPQDAAVLQTELDYQYLQLKATPAGAEVAGVSVLTTHDVSSHQLSYVLQHSGAARTSLAAPWETATSTHDGSTAPQSYAVPPSESASPEGTEVTRTFQDVYRILAEQSPDAMHPSTSKEGAKGQRDGRGGHPDTLVSDAIRIAAITQVFLQRREAQLRGEFAAAQHRSAVSADSEAVARAAQKVEMKTMVTEAVEEVSVRHEQATAHLVKTLSSMAGQWSLEKLSDTLEAIMRDEVKPIMDVLEERLGNYAPGASASPDTVAAAPSAAAAADSAAATSGAEASPSHAPEAGGAETAAALVDGQSEMTEALTRVLGELRELSARVSALPASLAPAKDAPAPEAVEAETWSLNTPPAVDEARLLDALRDLQREHQVELQQALDAIKEELHAAPVPAAPAAEAPTSSEPAMSAEQVETAVSRAVEEVSLALRAGIQQSVTQQMDSYCEVIRDHQSSSSSSADESNGSVGKSHSTYSSLPVLPVTSFELEEMITRTVDFAVRASAGELEERMRAAIEAAMQSHAAAAPRAEPEEGGIGSSGAMKAALEELWMQVKAEAAEEEAVKLSQHNRQLHRLFRRQQHLQRTRGGSANDATAADEGLTILAVEGAVRAAMYPYMAQMQAALAAAASTTNTGPHSSSTPDKEE